jgi:hypothetical protein
MPQTPILALPYPADTDPADVPTDMGELANRVEAVRGAINGLAALGTDGKVPSAQLPIVGYGTTLPASPVDGQEAILVDSVTNPSYQWRFRYNASSSSAYKWEFVGGARASLGPLPTSGFNFTSTTPISLTGGPSFTLPRAGNYEVSAGLFMQNNATVTMPYSIEAGINISPERMARMTFVVPNGQTYMGGTTASLGRVLGIASGTQAFFEVWATQAIQSQASLAWLSIQPIRVS